MKKPKSFIKFLKSNNVIKKKDNLYYAEDAFVVNAVLHMCMDSQNPKFSRAGMQVIEQFLEGKIDLTIEDNQIVIKEKRSKEDT